LLHFGLHASDRLATDGTLRAMSRWQYAQLTIMVDGRAVQKGKRIVLWHGPRPATDQDY